MDNFEVKVLCRNPDNYIRETSLDIRKVPRNYDPDLHPFQDNREYVRALNAAKLQRVFAKPFVGSLDGHKDVIYTLAKHPTQLSLIASGSGDGEVRLWNLIDRTGIKAVRAHSAQVLGLCFPHSGNVLYTTSLDRTLKKWDVKGLQLAHVEPEPLETIVTQHAVTGIHHHRTDPIFATCGDCVHLWEDTRAEPIRTMQWGETSVASVAFNQIETNILGACLNNTSVMLYDTREANPIRKLTMKMKSNKICWNPMEAFVFTLCSDDYSSYTFDMRFLKKPQCIHMGHLGPAIDLDYSPTGQEFVTISYDRTLRIFNYRSNHSREVYHTSRMHRGFTVLWSQDNKYVMCGSADLNVRIWKSTAWERLDILKKRQRLALEYHEKLVSKHSNHPQIRKITNYRHLPRSLYNAQKTMNAMKSSLNRKQANLEAKRSKSKRVGPRPEFIPEHHKSVLKDES